MLVKELHCNATSWVQVKQGKNEKFVVLSNQFYTMLNKAVADVWQKICSVDLKIQKFKRLSPLLTVYSTNVKESHWMGCECVIKKLLRDRHRKSSMNTAH